MGCMSMETLAKTLAAAAGALALAAGAPAIAQVDSDSGAPVDITADALEVINSQCMSIWSGAAEALQDRTRLRADTLKTYSRKGPARAGGKEGSCGETTRIEAIGNVYYVTPQQRVRGDHANYDVAQDQIVITGDVVAVQGENVLRGQRLTVNVKTGDAQMQSSSKGRASNARPRAVIYPSKSQPAGQTAARN
jgi:lipopolysaccharide export system protein LptA